MRYITVKVPDSVCEDRQACLSIFTDIGRAAQNGKKGGSPDCSFGTEDCGSASARSNPYF